MRALGVYLRLFVVTGVAFGLLMAVVLGASFAVLDMDAGVGAVGGLAAGLPFGLAMSAILGTGHVIGHRRTPPGTSLGPRQEETVAVPGDPGLSDRVMGALWSLPAEVTDADVPAGRYVARTRRSWKSWGEEVVVQLSGDPARPLVTVTSRPTVRTTLVDYGRGRHNVEHVLRALTPTD